MECNRLQHAENNEQNSTEHYLNIAEVIILSLDRNGCVTLINRMGCELLGLSQDQIIGKNWFDHFVPPIEWPERRNIFKNFLEGKFGDFFRHEGGILTHDNSHRIMSWLVHGRYSLSGDCIGIFASGKDITRERQLENEKMYALRQIEENVAKFAVLNDQIRNPLCTILTLASMLDDEIIANMITDQVEMIDSIVKDIDRRWIESEKILEFLRKHRHIDFKKPAGKR